MRVKKIKKKSGGYRTVYCQGPHDKHRYRTIAAALTTRLFELCPSDRCMMNGPTDRPRIVRGFMPGENPVTNAMCHVGKKFMLNCDLKDFFDHCTEALVKKGIVTPFISSRCWTVEDRRLEDLAAMACIAPDGRPHRRGRVRDEYAARQGLSSSPSACNIAALPMDREILSVLPDTVTYTRYADDLCFSSDSMDELIEVRDQLPAICKAHGQQINEKKTRMQCAKFGRMNVTGVAIDSDGVHPTRAVRRKLRAARHRAEMRPHWYNKAVMKGLQEWSLCKTPKIVMEENLC